MRNSGVSGRQRARLPARANTNTGAGFLFCGLDSVQEREVHWLLGIFVFIRSFGLFGIEREGKTISRAAAVERGSLLSVGFFDQLDRGPALRRAQGP